MEICATFDTSKMAVSKKGEVSNVAIGNSTKRIKKFYH